MKKIVLVSAGAVAAAACAYAAVPEPSPRARAELADVLRGRVAEPPVACVNQRDLAGNRSIGEGVILFRGRSSKMVYVNRPPAGCPIVDTGRALIVRTPSTRLCRGDIVQVVDLVSNSGYGACGLGDFEPYRRVAAR